MNSTEHVGPQPAASARPTESDTTVDTVLIPHGGALTRTLASCAQAQEDVRRTQADLLRRMTELTHEFEQLRAALNGELLEKGRLQQEVERLRRAPGCDHDGTLRELHHRVNNNLQIIISLFHLQMQYVPDAETRSLLQESQNRVFAMALIHERLYLAGEQGRIEFADYVRSLTAHLFRACGMPASRVALDVDAGDIAFNIETMIPCGLILNELVTNALQYAFPEERSGKVEIRLRRLPEAGEYELAVRDDGVGLPPGVSLAESQSLGMQIIAALSEQLEGAAAAAGPPGTAVVLRFREQQKSRRPS